MPRTIAQIVTKCIAIMQYSTLINTRIHDYGFLSSKESLREVFHHCFDDVVVFSILKGLTSFIMEALYVQTVHRDKPEPLLCQSLRENKGEKVIF